MQEWSSASGWWATFSAGRPSRRAGIQLQLNDARNYMCVTGACQMVPRTVFERLGGYDEGLGLSFSDVVL